VPQSFNLLLNLKVAALNTAGEKTLIRAVLCWFKERILPIRRKVCTANAYGKGSLTIELHLSGSAAVSASVVQTCAAVSAAVVRQCCCNCFSGANVRCCMSFIGADVCAVCFSSADVCCCICFIGADVAHVAWIPNHGNCMVDAADLARQDCSACRSLAIPHAPLVPVKQLAGGGERLPQAVAMQRHLHICIAAEVTASCFDPFWQTLAWWQDCHNSLQGIAALHEPGAGTEDVCNAIKMAQGIFRHQALEMDIIFDYVLYWVLCWTLAQ